MVYIHYASQKRLRKRANKIHVCHFTLFVAFRLLKKFTAMDEFTIFMVQEEQYRRMKADAPEKNAGHMLSRGYVPMLLNPEKDLVWGSMQTNGIMTPYMITSKNAKGLQSSLPAPLEVSFVGKSRNAQLSSMGNILHETSFPLVPAQMHHMDPQISHSFHKCNLEAFNTALDEEENDALCGFNRQKAKQGCTIIADPGCNDFDANIVIFTIFGKRGLVQRAVAYYLSQPENRPVLEKYYKNFYDNYQKPKEDEAAIYQAVLNMISDSKNAYHFAYEAAGGAVTLPVYCSIGYERKKDKKTQKVPKPQNDKFFDPHFDPTNGLKKLFKQWKAGSYSEMKKVDVDGKEIGFNPGDQARLSAISNPIVAITIKARIFWNSYNNLTLSLEPNHSGIKILYDGPPPTASDIATFEEWKLTGETPPRNQINMAMVSDLSNVIELSKSVAMQQRREEFYRKRNLDAMILQLCSAEDAQSLISSANDEIGDDEPQSPTDSIDEAENNEARKRLKLNESI